MVTMPCDCEVISRSKKPRPESVLRGILFREECAHVDRPLLTLIRHQRWELRAWTNTVPKYRIHGEAPSIVEGFGELPPRRMSDLVLSLYLHSAVD